MRGREGIVCPACGTLNKTTWEFCARCNEPLEGGAPTLPPAPTVVDAGGYMVEDEAPTDTSALVLMASLAAMVVLFGMAYRSIASNPPPSGPDPGIFTIPSQPPAPPVIPTGGGPGEDQFDDGRLLLGSGDVAGALSALEGAGAADPENAQYRTMLAAAYWRNGDADRALAENAEAARLDPRLQAQYARALDVAGHTEEALDAYREVVAQNPDAALVREDLGRLLFRTGAYADAATHLEAAVQNRPGDPVLSQEYAYALDQAGQKQRATEAYKQVLERAPQAVITRGLLSENLYQQGRRDDAMNVVQEGLALNPDAPLRRRQLGSLLERAGKKREAAEAYREYARLAPNAPDAGTLAARATSLEGTRGGQP